MWSLKNLFFFSSKIEFGSGWPPLPPVWWITRLFTRFVLWNLPLLKLRFRSCQIQSRFGFAVVRSWFIWALTSPVRTLFRCHTNLLTTCSQRQCSQRRPFYLLCTRFHWNTNLATNSSQQRDQGKSSQCRPWQGPCSLIWSKLFFINCIGCF